MKELLILLASLTLTSCVRTPQCCSNNSTLKYSNRSCSDDSPVLLKYFCHTVYMEPSIIYANDTIFDLENNVMNFVEPFCVARLYTDPLRSVALVCLPDAVNTVEDLENTYIKQAIYAIISVIFLTLTIIVYAWLPQLRNVQSRCIICLCGCQALAFAILALLQLKVVTNSVTVEVCRFFGYSLYFWLMSTFFWTNVVSVQLFLRISNPPFLRKYKHNQTFLFAVYAIFAWSASLLLLLVTIIADHVEGTHLKSGIGELSCWLNGNVETWAFFYGPMSVLIAINVVLFIATSFRLWSTASAYEGSALVILKRRFMLSLRLFLVMGISWVFEVASFTHGSPHIIWKIADTFNCLLGLWFFILLVLRMPVLRGLAAKGLFGSLGHKYFQPKQENDIDDMLSDEESPHEIQMNKFAKTNPI